MRLELAIQLSRLAQISCGSERSSAAQAGSAHRYQLFDGAEGMQADPDQRAQLPYRFDGR